MPASTLTSKGQLTVPLEIRVRLNLKQGDRLLFRFDESGQLILEPDRVDPLAGLRGALAHLAPEKPVTLEAMNEAIRDSARRRFERSRQ